MNRQCLLFFVLASLGAGTCQDEVCSGMGSSMLQKRSFASRPLLVSEEEEGETTVQPKKVIDRKATADRKEKKQKTIIQPSEIAAETESVEHKHVSDARQGGVGDTPPAAGELAANSANSKTIETQGQGTESKDIETQGKEAFDGAAHEAENEHGGNGRSNTPTEEAWQEAVEKAAARSETAATPIKPLATKTGWGPILHESGAADDANHVILAKETGSSTKTSKETEASSASTTKTGERKNKPDRDGLAAIENQVRVRSSRKSHKRRKSSLHFHVDTEDKMGPAGMAYWNQPKENALTIEVDAPAAKPSTKSGADKEMASPAPHAAVTPPASTGKHDLHSAKNASHAQERNNGRAKGGKR